MARRKGNDYFDMISKLNSYSMEAALKLQDTLKNFKSDDLDRKLFEMHEIEHSADIEKHNMMKKLSKEFITPIEREDLVSLAQQLDTVTDNIEDILINASIYNIKSVKQEALEFTDLIVKCCKSLEIICTEFADFKKSNKISDEIIRLNQLEEDGDRLYAQATKKLFADENTDARKLLIWNEMFMKFEECCDSCEDVSDVIESVIMKNS